MTQLNDFAPQTPTTPQNPMTRDQRSGTPWSSPLSWTSFGLASPAVGHPGSPQSHPTTVAGAAQPFHPSPNLAAAPVTPSPATIPTGGFTIEDNHGDTHRSCQWIKDPAYDVHVKFEYDRAKRDAKCLPKLEQLSRLCEWLYAVGNIDIVLCVAIPQETGYRSYTSPGICHNAQDFELAQEITGIFTKIIAHRREIFRHKLQLKSDHASRFRARSPHAATTSSTSSLAPTMPTTTTTASTMPMTTTTAPATTASTITASMPPSSALSPAVSLEEEYYWDDGSDWNEIMEHLLPKDIITYLMAADVPKIMFMQVDLIWTRYREAPWGWESAVKQDVVALGVEGALAVGIELLILKSIREALSIRTPTSFASTTGVRPRSPTLSGQ